MITSAPFMKTAIQSALRWVGIYERIKTSWAYDAYWSVTKPSVIEGILREVAHYKARVGLQPGDLVFDIGANHGEMADVFLRAGCRVVAVEPDEYCQGVLRRKYHRWRLRSRPVEVVGLAVSDSAGVAQFRVSTAINGCAKNTLSAKSAERFSDVTFDKVVEVRKDTLDSLIRKYGRPKFIKIDVEGHELEALSGLSAPVEFVQFEVNLPQFLSEGQACIATLEKLSPGAQFTLSHEGQDMGPMPARHASEQLRCCDFPSVDVVCHSRL